MTDPKLLKEIDAELVRVAADIAAMFATIGFKEPMPVNTNPFKYPHPKS